MVGAVYALPLWLVPVLFHAEDCADEVFVGSGRLVPALQAQVALLQPFHMHLDPLRVHGVDSLVVAIVALYDQSQNVFVHTHRLAVMAHARVQLRQQLRHLERLWVEGAPYAAEVVADVFAESDSVGTVIFVGIRCLHVAATDRDDGGRGPFLLDFAGGPEELEEPLSIVVVSLVIWVGARVRGAYFKIYVVLLFAKQTSKVVQLTQLQAHKVDLGILACL